MSTAAVRSEAPSLLELAEEILASELAPRESDGDVAVREGYCTGCDKRVAVDAEDRCVWCSGPTARAMSRAERLVRLGRVCPSCRGQKGRGSLQCRRCAGQRGRGRRDPVSGRFAREVAEEDFVCPDCDGPKSYNAKRCWGCYVARGGHRGRKHRKEGTLRRISDELLIEAKRIYVEEGVSIRAVAARIHGRTEYASVASCAQGLFQAFARRGWRLRDQGATTGAANRRRAEVRGLPFCTYVKADGRRCERRTSKGQCWHHRPERLAQGIARLRAIDGNAARRKVSEETLAEARAIYRRDPGLSWRELGERVIERTEYTTLEGAAKGLFHCFRARGWVEPSRVAKSASKRRGGHNESRQEKGGRDGNGYE